MCFIYMECIIKKYFHRKIHSKEDDDKSQRRGKCFGTHRAHRKSKITLKYRIDFAKKFYGDFT